MSTSPILFITGIGTEIGKTLASAIIVEKLKADYWKPVQSGDLDDSDSSKVSRLVSNEDSVFFPETYRLSQPYSPHKSAALDGIRIDEKLFTVPPTRNALVVEGAGGLMVPLNDHFLMVDLIKKLKAEVILVSRNYLGSINHTLLSVELLHQRAIPVRGILFNGNDDGYSTGYITDYTGLRTLGHLPEFEVIDKQTVRDAGKYIDL